MAAHRESAYRQFQNRVRGFNKRYLNPVTLRFAGRPLSPHGVVRHVGRRSGRTYDTPVLMGTSGDQFVVPLLYGTDTDWYQNVRAADGCTILWQGSAYRTRRPRLVDPAAVPEAFPHWMHRLVERGGAEQYLRLERAEEAPHVYREVTAAHPAGPLLAGAVGALLLGVALRRAAKLFKR